MNPLLMIMHPRQIPECIEALEALEIEKVWLSRFTEYELCDVVFDLVESTDYSHYLMISDDAKPTQEALDAVLGLLEDHPVATGYSPLSEGHENVNLCKTPLLADYPMISSYDLYSLEEVRSYPSEVVPTHFMGMCLTGMSRDLWLEYPFGCYGAPSASYGSDFHLSSRLRDDAIPMVAAREGYVEHVKTAWNETDRTPGRELLVGVEPSGVRW